MKGKILIVEDDRYISNYLKMSLKEEEYECITAATGKDALRLENSENPDMIILDLGLPDIDGTDIIMTIRRQSEKPIIVVSARSDENEKIYALDLGANDYVTKPFHLGELMARIRAAQRTVMGGKKELPVQGFELDGLKVDFEKREVRIDDQEIHMTPIEFNLLRLLIENKGKVLTHHMILKEVWGYEDESTQKSLRVYMATLRRKIEKDTSHPHYIMTEVGVGYRFIG